MEKMDASGVRRSVLARKRTSPGKKMAAKCNKQRKKPVKVVYISNPMRISTSASSFRNLVQRLTGQDSELPDDPAMFDLGSGSFYHAGVAAHDLVVDEERGGGITVRTVGGPRDEVHVFEEEEEGFINPRMLESLSEFLPPSLFVESSSDGN